MAQLNITPFSRVYDAFFNKITDDMYMELTENDTYFMLQTLLEAAICQFEFPRINLMDYVKGSYPEDIEMNYILNNGNAEDMNPPQGAEIDYEHSLVIDSGDAFTSYDPEKDLPINKGYFNCILSIEEINILATYMVVEWLGQQLASIENVRMKYSGSDFKFTSQANHIAKLIALQKEYESKGFHLQRLYKRRKADEKGIMRSTIGDLRKKRS